jgi:hypothetical protein
MGVWGRKLSERQRDLAMVCDAKMSEFFCPQNFLVLFSYKKNSPTDIHHR